MAIKKYAKKLAKKAIGYAKKRYVRKGRPNVGRIVKDVAYLKSVLNPEKKIYQQNQVDGLVGQCDVNNNGYFLRDITSVMAQGTTNVTRNGNSIRVCSAYAKFQLQMIDASRGPGCTFHAYIIRVRGQPQTLADIPANMFKANSFITGGSIIDVNSDRDEETFSQYQVIAKRVVRFPSNNHNTQHLIKNFRIPLKFKNYHVKFSANGSNVIQDGQLVLLVLSDNGNISTTTASTLVGTQSTAIDTGHRIQMDYTAWYYDN